MSFVSFKVGRFSHTLTPTGLVVLKIFVFVIIIIIITYYYIITTIDYHYAMHEMRRVCETENCYIYT